MCAPVIVPIMGFAMSAVGTLAQMREQNKMANAANRATEDSAKEAVKGLNYDMADLEQQRAEARADAVAELEDNAVAGYKATSQAEAAYSESGMTGRTVDSVMRDLTGQISRNAATVKSNYQRQSQGITANQERMRMNTEASFKGVKGVRGASVAAGALTIAGQAASAYAQYTAAKAESPKDNPLKLDRPTAKERPWGIQ